MASSSSATLTGTSKKDATMRIWAIFAVALAILSIVSASALAQAPSVCNCAGYAGPGGPCYRGPGGACYGGPGGPADRGPGGSAYDGPGGPTVALAAHVTEDQAGHVTIGWAEAIAALPFASNRRQKIRSRKSRERAPVLHLDYLSAFISD